MAKSNASEKLHNTEFNPNLANKCSICVKLQALDNSMESVDDSPEFEKCVQELKANGDGEQTAKTITYALLNWHFLNRSEQFSFGNCYESIFESCRGYFLIKKQVEKQCPHAGEEFDLHVKSWFKHRYSLVLEDLRQYLSDVDVQREPTVCEKEEMTAMQTTLSEQCEKSAKSFLCGILNHIFEENAVGLALHFGMDSEKGHLYSLIHDIVSKRFSPALDRNVIEKLVKNWLSDCHKFSYSTLLSVHSPGQDYFTTNNCNLCEENKILRDKKRKNIERKENRFEGGVANSLKQYFPESPHDLVKMVQGFLDQFFLNENINKHHLTRNCFGKKFQNCYLMDIIIDQTNLEFPEGTEKEIKNCVQDWFNHQKVLFMNVQPSVGIKALEIEIKHEKSSEYCTNIMDAIVNNTLDSILEKNYVGFILTCGSKKLPMDLQNKIYDTIIKKYPQLTELPKSFYDDSICKWFESKCE